MAESHTERGDYRFTVKKFADGTPWIVLEPLGRQLNVLGDGFLGFELKPRTSLDQADRIADFMNRNIDTVSYTSLVRSKT
jgi:hypothetical protein